MKAVGAINPGMDFNNHSKAVMEALPANNWIAVDSMPHSLVEGQKDAAGFWLNKIRVAFKGKDDRHTTWCVTLEKLLAALHVYVKTHHKMGLTWKPLGQDIAGAVAPAAAASAAGKSDDGAAKVAAAAAGLAAELSKLDQSSGRTAGLRRVTKDMKAKNQKGQPALQPKAKGAPAVRSAAGAAKAVAVKPPKLQLVGKRWFCEHQTGEVTIDVKVAVQDVYIYNCNGATIFINGKCNAMQVDKCTKTQVLFDSVISAASVVDCKRLQIQARGKCHCITLDKTDGAQIFLSFASRHAQLTTSKCSELNFNYPETEAEDSDWKEHPIPEQFITQLHADGSVSTVVSDLYSA
jgi:adenylyl cyclase-associated protein